MIADPDPQKGARVMQAMFGMTKFDIAGLERLLRRLTVLAVTGLPFCYQRR